MLTVNVMINVMIIGQPPVTAIIRWRARLAYESTVTVMDPISETTLKLPNNTHTSKRYSERYIK